MLWSKTFLLIFYMLPWSPPESLKPHVLHYIEQYKFFAIDEMVRSGIPASIIMAQAIVETNAGTSNLARKSNNHFGIKCKSYWDGETYYAPDDDRDAKGNIIPSCFRQYDNVIASYKDHSDFLVHTKHYNGLFAYDKMEYESWAKGLELCGYATDPNYAEKLIKTIRMYGLHELDFYTIEYVEPGELTGDEEEVILTIK